MMAGCFACGDAGGNLGQERRGGGFQENIEAAGAKAETCGTKFSGDFPGVDFMVEGDEGGDISGGGMQEAEIGKLLVFQGWEDLEI